MLLTWVLTFQPPKNSVGPSGKSEGASSNELAFISFFNVIKALIGEKKNRWGGGRWEREREKNEKAGTQNDAFHGCFLFQRFPHLLPTFLHPKSQPNLCKAMVVWGEREGEEEKNRSRKTWLFETPKCEVGGAGPIWGCPLGTPQSPRKPCKGAPPSKKGKAFPPKPRPSPTIVAIEGPTRRWSGGPGPPHCTAPPALSPGPASTRTRGRAASTRPDRARPGAAAAAA